MIIHSRDYSKYYFQEKSGIFYFRIVTPHALRDRFPNIQKEIRRSLGTAKKQQARRQAARLYMYNLAKFETALENLDTIDDALNLIPQVLRLNSKIPSDALSNLEGRIALIREQHTQLLHERLIDEISEKEKSCIRGIGICLEMLSQYSAEESTILYNKYSEEHELPDTTLDQLKKKISNLVARCKNAVSKETISNDSNLNSGTQLSKNARSLLFSATSENFINERESGGTWTEKTKNSYIATFNVFTEMFGDIPITKLNAQICRDFKNNIQKLPKNHMKVNEFRSLTIKELVSMNIAAQEKISIESVNKHIGRISSFLNWSVQQSYIDRNFMSGMNIRISQSQIENRLPFNSDDLNNLFLDPIYTDGKVTRNFYFWLPLIALYSGARIQEICQLELDDIYEKEGVLILDINDNSPNKRLKNTSSNRLIPIHEHLITLGLTRYCHSLKKHKNRTLFPELNKNASRDGQSSLASKWFARYKKKHGFPTDGVKAFHSFRHTFIDELKRLDTPEHISAALAGHSHESITYGVYGSNDSIQSLNNAVQKITFEGFDTSGIRWFPN